MRKIVSQRTTRSSTETYQEHRRRANKMSRKEKRDVREKQKVQKWIGKELTQGNTIKLWNGLAKDFNRP